MWSQFGTKMYSLTQSHFLFIFLMQYNQRIQTKNGNLETQSADREKEECPLTGGSEAPRGGPQ